MKVILGIGIAVVLLLITSYFIFSPKMPSPVLSSLTPTPIIPDGVDRQATFAIFTNGTFRIFTDPRYHNKSQDVYIEENNPNVVQVKKSGVTWGDFFLTLPMKVTANCLTTGTGQEFCSNKTHTLKFYINGVPFSDVLSEEIKPQDKLLISYGPESDPDIENQLQKVPNL